MLEARTSTSARGDRLLLGLLDAGGRSRRSSCCRSSRSPTSSRRASSGGSSGRSRRRRCPCRCSPRAPRPSAGPGPARARGLRRRTRVPLEHLPSPSGVHAFRATAGPSGLGARAASSTTTDAVAKPDAGDTVGPYRDRVRCSARAAWAASTRRAARTGETVALKLVQAELAEDAVFRKRFEREAGAAPARRRTAHVVPVLDTGEHEGIPYMAQQFIGGGSLAGQDRARRAARRSRAAVTICLAGRQRARRAARRGPHPPRPQAGNILLDERGRRLHHRLRARQGPRRERPDQARPGARLDGLHGARADPRRGGHGASRRLRARLRDATSASSGEPAVRRPPGHADPVGPPPGRAAGPVRQRGDLPQDVGWAVTRALEKEPERRPPSATAYARMVQVAAGSAAAEPGRSQ